MPDRSDEQRDDAPAAHVAVPVRIASAEQRDALLALAQERAPDPAIFKDYPPVFFSANASNGGLDTYFTHMAPSTLRNYADDATAGVPFLDSHQRDSLARTLGYSLTGKYTQGRGDSPARTAVDFYTVQGLDPAIDAFIGKARAGIARDVSIGFSGGRYICNICGGEMFDWFADRETRCTHLPGVKYPVTNKQGDKGGETVTAEARIEDARLSEVSTVFKGSTPAAGIVGVKARQLADAGLLLPGDRAAFEARYQVRLPGGFAVPGVSLPAGSQPEQEEATVPTTDEIRALVESAEGQPVAEGIAQRARDAAAADLTRQLADALTGAGMAIEENKTIVDAVRGLCADVLRLRALADDGNTYRTDLIAQVVEEGVRAFGNEYEAEQEKAELASLPLAGVKRRLALYTAAAAKGLPAGRGTEEGQKEPLVSPTSIKSKRRGTNRAFAV